MALKGKLAMWSESQQVRYGYCTCTSGKKVYIKSIIAHAAGGGSIGTATGQVYFTQAGVTTGPIQRF